MWIIIVLLFFKLGVDVGIYNQDQMTMEETMMIYNYGKPLSEYKHTIREVVYELDVNGDGKYDSTYKWIRNNK